ncbi:hypothetical protein [Streptomyces sp. Iso 434]|uniref:hypothetical protein n=1 Tax=Streptomyces sp. Iso 434 TaxID=3062272 RepID=UPI00397EEFB5
MTETTRCALVSFDGGIEFADLTPQQALRAAKDNSARAERGTDFLSGGVCADYSRQLTVCGEDPRRVNTIAELMAQFLWPEESQNVPPGPGTNPLERYQGTVVFRMGGRTPIAEQERAITQAHREAVNSFRERGWTVPDGALKSLS